MMLEGTTTEFLERLASSEPAPGGGGACAAVGAFAAALGEMVANLTIGKQKYKETEEEMKEVLEQLTQKRNLLMSLVDEDAIAFLPLTEAYRIPKDDPKKDERMEAAMCMAAGAPMELMQVIVETMQLIRFSERCGSIVAVSDAGVGLLLAQAALEGSALNVFINTKLMKNREKAGKMNADAFEMIEEGKAIVDETMKSVYEKLGIE